MKSYQRINSYDNEEVTMKKILSIVTVIMLISSVFTAQALAASHDPDNPTVLTPNVSYLSNAYYGDEYYTFTLDEESKVNIWLGRVAINHTYEMTLHGNEIEPIATNDSSHDDALTLNAVLEPGIYYIDVDPDFDGTPEYRTEPGETIYNIIVMASPV